jgi:Protein of unknown function (DUF3237)
VWPAIWFERQALALVSPSRIGSDPGWRDKGGRQQKEDHMAEIRTSRLLTLKLAVNGLQPIGETPSGNRRVGLVAGGTFEGPKLRGIVLPGGADWIIGRPDGVTTLDVRIVLQTDDGASIGLTYRGLRHGPAEVMEKVNSGQFVDPSQYYFRTVMNFETASPKYAWLNKIFAIGTGSRPPEGPVYDVFEVL